MAVGHAAVHKIEFVIIAEVRRPRTGILFEAIRSIVAVYVDMVGERNTVVGQRPRRDLPGRVIAKALRRIIRCAGAIKIMRQAAETADRVIAVACCRGRRAAADGRASTLRKR